MLKSRPMPAFDQQALPDDPVALKSLLTDLLEQLNRREEQLTNERQKVELLQEQIRLLLHKRFGASSERDLHSGQQSLFNEAETEADVESAVDETDDTDVVEVAAHTKKKPGRKPLPAHLPRVVVRHDLADADKVCDCGHPLHCIGEDISEQLDIIPEEIYVIHNILPKYACRQCDEGGVTTAPVPTRIIPKSNVTPGLLAYVATAKYVDGLPLHRMEKMFDRLEYELSRRTMANWMIHLATILDPLLEQLKIQLLQSHVLLMDETRVQVLDESNSQSYMWVTVSGGTDPPVVCYTYNASRSGDVPGRILEAFTGVLVTDGYAGYNAVGRGNQAVHAGCMAHVRRKFDEALKVQGKQRTGRAQMALSKIRKLYAIEARIKDYAPDDRRKVRQTEARPVMDELRIWLDQCIQDVAPKTALGKALMYMHREWKRLLPYLDDGHIPIDNNRCENAIRPFVIGRKAWLFSKSIRGANASATIYSIIESAKANHLEPYHYLRYVLTEIAAGNHDYQSMLPYTVDPARIAIRRVG